MIQSHNFRFLGLSVVALLACAAGCAAESSDGGNSGPIYNVTGGVTGSGGIAGTGATAAGTGATASGTGATASGTGATGSGTGGVVSGTGGTTSTPVACTGAATLDGYMDNGTMCGYAYTGTFKDGGTINPPCGTGACFTGATICNEGEATIPASVPGTPGVSPGIMIGWNVAQASGSATASTWTSTGTGVTVNFTATGATGQTRVVLKSGGQEFCAPVTSGTQIPWSSFKVQCWDGGAQSPTFTVGSPVEALILQINAVDAGAQTITDFCLNSVVNN